MILTGSLIKSEVECKRITINPFKEDNIEPNSYGFRLARDLIMFDENQLVDAARPTKYCKVTVPDSGYVLQPKRLYLGCTLEIMGSHYYAKTLHARRSVASAGMWIHFSSPLGHTGAIIPWTLEITVCHPLVIYPAMLIGKIAFWVSKGERVSYNGRYKASTTVESSRSYRDSLRRRHPSNG